MECYETDIMTHPEAVEFARKFDEKIGTDREINDAGGGDFYVFCLDLEIEEIPVCISIEHEIKSLF